MLAQAPLSHPNLIQLWGGIWNEGADKVCVVQEFAEMGSIETLLASTSKEGWDLTRFKIALNAAHGVRFRACG